MVVRTHTESFDANNGIRTEFDRSPIGFLKSDLDLIPRSWRFIGSSSDSDQVHLGVRPNSEEVKHIKEIIGRSTEPDQTPSVFFRLQSDMFDT